MQEIILAGGESQAEKELSGLVKELVERKEQEQISAKQVRRDIRDYKDEMHRRTHVAPAKAGGGAKEIARRAKQLAKKAGNAGA